MNKYVIFKHKGQFMPVVMPEHVSHSMVKLDESEVHSAGFFTLEWYSEGMCEVTIHDRASVSLGVGPSPIDQRILELAYEGAGTSAFLVDLFA